MSAAPARMNPLEAAFSTFFHGLGRLGARTFGGRYARVTPACDVPPEEVAIDGPAGRIACLRWPGPGTGTPLLLVHGLNSNAWSWARVASLLSADRPVIAVHQRGHGGSCVPPAGYRAADCVDDLIAVLDRLAPPGPVDVAGQSWGGKVAFLLAATHPDRVRSLVLADPVPPAGLNRVLGAFPRLVEAAERIERGPFPDRDALIAAARRLVFAVVWDATDLRLVDASFRQAPDGSWHHVLTDLAYRRILREGIGEDLTSAVARVQCPALLLRPTVSISFLPGDLADLRRIPGLAEARVPGDHTFPHSNPLDTVDAMRAFWGTVRDATP